MATDKAEYAVYWRETNPIWRIFTAQIIPNDEMVQPVTFGVMTRKPEPYSMNWKEESDRKQRDYLAKLRAKKRGE
jgi:hypothetical protein